MAMKTGNSGDPLENISSSSFAADLNYYHLFSPVMIRVLAEYNSTTTQNKDYPWFSDSAKTMRVVPSFNNHYSGWFAGATIRLAGSNSTFLSNLELGGRIGAYTPPNYTVAAATPAPFGTTSAPWGEDASKQTTVCQ